MFYLSVESLRQKGIMHLLRAAEKLPAEIGLVLCASSPDTKELGAEVAEQIEKLAKTRTGVHWITEQVSRSELIELLSNAAVFSCPSIYEPLGIVNLEAMACEVPVVASNVGGIPEVVIDGETGYLVNYDENETAAYELEFAQKLTQVVNDQQAASRMGSAGRKRAELEFGWDKIANQTMAVYETAMNNFRK